MNRLSGKIDVLIFGGIIKILIFSPLAFGSVHVWAYTIMQVGIFLIFWLYWIHHLIILPSTDLEWIKTSINKVLWMIFIFISIQMVPLPPTIIAYLSPITWEDKHQMQQIILKANGLPTESLDWMSLSYAIHPAVREWLKLAAYFCMFFLVLHTLKSKRRMNILIYILIFSGLFQTLYAIYQVFSENPKIWWWASRVGKAKYASGTFIVSNHFAFYLEMIFPLTFGFMIAQKKRDKRFLPGHGGFRASVQRIVAWFSPESYQPKYLFFFFIAIIIGLGLLLSASRGGILSMSASMFIMSILFLLKKHFRRYGAVALMLCIFTFVYGLYVGLDPTLNKFEQIEGLYQRLQATKTLFPIISDYPITGVGWGNLNNIYSRYIQEGSPEIQLGAFAGGYSHNDWVEAFAEIGITGGILLVSAFLIFWYRLVKLWMTRNSYHAVGVGAGVIAGMLSIGFHSYFDFSMHIPANPTTLAAFLGIGYVALHRTGHGYNESFFYVIKKKRLTKFRRTLAISIITVTMVGFITLSIKHFIAEWYCPTEWNSTLNLNWNPYLTDIEKAISYNSLNDEYYFKRGHFYAQRKHQIDDKATFIEFNEKAIKNFEQAVWLNPVKGTYWLSLAEQYSKKEYDIQQYVDFWLVLADNCMNQAVKNEPYHIGILSGAAVYWVRRSNLLPESSKSYLTKEQGIQIFQNLFQRILTIKPNQWKWAATHVSSYYSDEAIILGISPKSNAEISSKILEWITVRNRN